MCAYRVRAMDCRWAFCSVPSHTRPVPPAEPAEVCCPRSDVDSSTRYRSALCTLRTPGPRLAGKSCSTRSPAPLPARRSPGQRFTQHHRPVVTWLAADHWADACSPPDESCEQRGQAERTQSRHGAEALEGVDAWKNGASDHLTWIYDYTKA